MNAIRHCGLLVLFLLLITMFVGFSSTAGQDTLDLGSRLQPPPVSARHAEADLSPATPRTTP